MADRQFMLRALALARRGQGRVEPNPMVGCVLVRRGRIIGEGYHRQFGGPHAEIEALRDCRRHGQSPAGCEVYVTLEPCCHHGKTPPCTDALIQARVGRVIVAMADPFPQVAGRGIRQLRRAGIPVEAGLGASEARQLNEPFLKRVATGLPWVIAKWAQTLDGCAAGADGQSKWISNEASRAHVHELRARVDAVVVGIGTVLADDPLLTARLAGSAPPARFARRVVVDPNLRLPARTRLLASLPTPLTLAVRAELVRAPTPRLRQLQKLGVEFVGLPASRRDPARLLLRPLLRHLARRHAATNVLVEGGPTLLGALLAQRLADQIMVFVAPKICGHADALAAVRGLEGRRIDQALPLQIHATRRFGDDLMIDYRLATSSSSTKRR